MVGTIDTDSIITQMMAVERRPQDILKARITALQTSQNAWQAIADKMTALKTASDALAGLNAASSLRSVASSDPTSVSVRSTGAAASTSASIDVIALASAQSVLVSDVFTSTTDSVGARTLDLTPAATGTLQTFTSADGTIGGLATAINSANIGITARVLQTAPGQYQLALTSTASGTATGFTAGGAGWGTFTTVRPAADAHIRVDGVDITRSTNVINDLLDGVELTLQKPTTSAVSVRSTRDDDAIVAKVKAMVDAANTLGSVVAAATKTSTDATARGPLAGDYTARHYMDTVRTAISSGLATSGGALITSSTMGVSLNKDGTIAFDSTKLTASLASNAAGVFAALGRDATSTAVGVTVAGATTGSTASTRAITVTQAATQAALPGVPVPLPAAGTVISTSLTTSNGTLNVSFTVGATWAQTAGNMNAAMRAAGAKAVATVQSSGGVDQGLNLTDERFGATGTFSISGAAALGVDGSSSTGIDAAGTVDGTPFTASGQSYVSNGLVLSITATAAQLTALGGSSSGVVTLTQGLSGALSAIGANGSATGPVSNSKDAVGDQITDLQKRVARYDDTLSAREAMLRTKFSAMQTMLEKLNSMSSSFANLSTSSS